MEFTYSLGATRDIHFPEDKVILHVDQFSVSTRDSSKRKVFSARIDEFKGHGPSVDLWTDDDYDTQSAGDGFTQTAIESKLDELFPA